MPELDVDHAMIQRVLTIAKNSTVGAFGSPTKTAEQELDALILPSNKTTFPSRDQSMNWLAITQIAMYNAAAYVRTGQSERACEIMNHYWRRWRGE